MSGPARMVSLRLVRERGQDDFDSLKRALNAVGEGDPVARHPKGGWTVRFASREVAEEVVPALRARGWLAAL